MTGHPELFRQAADLLDMDEVFDVAAGAIAEAREKAPRLRERNGQPIDRDSGEVLDELIAALRRHAADN
jgi:hypothetical protein